MEFALAGLFVAFTGAGIASVLRLALLCGATVAAIFFGIFYGMNRIGKLAARQSAAASGRRLEY